MTFSRVLSVISAVFALAACGPGGGGGGDAATGGDAASGGDAAMMGMPFMCGMNTCMRATQYCEDLTTTDMSGSSMHTYTCKPLPSGCTGEDFCMGCLSGMMGAEGCARGNFGDGPEYTVQLRRTNP